MQTFYLGQPPVLDVENDGLRMRVGHAVPQVLLRAGQMYREVREKLASQRPGHPRIFFENNHTLRHTYPDLPS